MPAAKPPEFRRRAVELARRREKPIAAIAADLGIAESCLRRWMKQDDFDAGRRLRAAGCIARSPAVARFRCG
jgi:transposase-like protein